MLGVQDRALSASTTSVASRRSRSQRLFARRVTPRATLKIGIGKCRITVRIGFDGPERGGSWRLMYPI